MKKQNFNYYAAGAVSLMTFLVYLPSLGNDFVNWDDTDLVLNNTHIRSIDLTFLKWAFSFFNPVSANWHPITWISHALDYAIWGLNPMGHHLTSIILHAVNTFLVVLLVVKLLETASRGEAVPRLKTGRSTESPLQKNPSVAGMTNQFSLSMGTKEILIAAATTGLLFGIHPLHVEPVCWVSGRADLLCAFFFLLSIMMYTRYITPTASPPPLNLRGGRGSYLISLAFFALALLSKPMAVSLPLALLLLDWYPYQRVLTLKTLWNALIEKIPYIALGLMAAIVAFLSRSSTGSILPDTPLSIRILVSFKSLIAYLWKMVLPFNLSSFYPYPDKNVSLLSVEYGSAVALAVVISMTCIFLARKEKLWMAIWGYYVVILLPVIGIIRIGIPAMSDRYTYLPSLGPFLITGLIVALISRKATTKKMGFIIMFAGAGIIISLSLLTVKQTGIWKNGLTLWTNVIEKAPEAPDGYFAYLNRGELFFRAGRLDEALEDFGKAIAYIPSFYTLYNRVGLAYGEQDSFDKAIECFNRSIAINPNDSMAYYYRGYTYSFVNQQNNALEDYSKAIELDQDNFKAYVQRGNLYLKTGDKGRAVSDFKKACDLGDKEGCNALQTKGLQTKNQGKH